MTNELSIESNSLEKSLSKLLDIHKTLEKLTPISNGINSIVDKLISISDSLGSGLGLIGTGLSSIGAGIGSIGSGINSIGTGLSSIGAGIGSIGSGISSIGSGISSIGKDIGTGLGKLGIGIGKLGTGIGKLAISMSKSNVGAGKLTAGIGKSSSGKGKSNSGKGKLGAVGVIGAGVGLLQMSGQLDALPDSVNNVIGMLSMMDFGMVKLGISSMVMGMKMAAAWLIGLGPIGLIIAAVAGIFTLLIFNIDNVMLWWNNFIENLKGISPVMAWIGSIFDVVVGNLLGGIQWLVDKFKLLFGMAGKKPPEYKDPATEKMKTVEQKIIPTYTKPNTNALKQNNPAKKGSMGNNTLETVNDTSDLPLSHMKFLEKNNLLEKSSKKGSMGNNSLETLSNTNKLPIEHTNLLEKNNLGEGVTKAGSMRSSHKVAKFNSSNTSQSSKQNTTINIDKVEISDGIISDLDSFILQLKHRITRA